jgi:diguanylate cyclase (GGDEF)-like protein
MGRLAFDSMRSQSVRKLDRPDDQGLARDPLPAKDAPDKRRRRVGDGEGWVTISRSRLELLEGEILELREALAKKDLQLQEKDLGYRSLLERAQIDEVTELHNRKGFWNEFRREHHRLRSLNLLSEVSSALLLLDIDFFKRVNDTHGHAAGDFVLHAVADVGKRRIQRAGDIGCRWGGEEFAFLLREQTRPNEETAGMGRRHADQLGSISNFTEQLRQAIETTPIILPASATPDGRPLAIRVTVSIGVLVWTGSPRDYGEAERDLEQRFTEVDRNLYLAKAQGRNRVVITEV